MTAGLILEEKCEHDIELLAYRDLPKLIETLEFLCDNPLGAQVAGYRKDPTLRRAVADKYLVFYRYEPENNLVRVYSVRHSARRPPKLKDLLPK